MFEQLSLFHIIRGNGKKPNAGHSKKNKFEIKEKSKNTLEFLSSEVEIVRRPYQRSLNILVKPNGRLRVTCARLTSKKILISFLKENETWIKKTLAEQKALQNKYPPKQYKQSEGFLFIGGQVYLNFSPTTAKKKSVTVSGDQLNVFIPQSEWSPTYSQKSHPELKDDIQKFYKSMGKKMLLARLNQLSEKMQLKPQKVSFRSQKTRWGSCSSEGNITLNWRLVAAPVEVQEYVIIHELAHLKYQDHSKSFWNLVRDYCPSVEEHKAWLRQHQFEFDFLSKVSELH